MGLTLNSNSLALEAAVGGGGAAGLTTADVTSLISSKGEWEFVAKYEVTATVTGFEIEGFDMTAYRGYKIVYENFYTGSVLNPHFKVMKAGSEFVNNNTYTMHRHGSSYLTNRNANSSNIYWNSSTNWGTDAIDRLNSEIEIYQNDATYYGYAKISQKNNGGYYDSHTEGNFVGNRSSDDVTGITLQSTWTSGTAYLYRTAKRA